MNDLILGAFTNYEYPQIQYWVNSILDSGFTGDVVVMVGNTSFATVEKLIQKGVKIIGFGQDRETHRFVYDSTLPIHTERFFHYWNFLKDHWSEYNNVILTDMKDVIFQTNPSDWLDENTIKAIVVGSECLKYEDEPWGRENLKQAFGPYFYECFKQNTIYNVGVIAGDAEYVRDLCLMIFQMTINRPIAIAEQAAFNVLIKQLPWCDNIDFLNMNSGWVAHLGTVMDPTKIEQFRPCLLEPELHQEPNNYILRTADKKEFCIVHQYDRVPELKKMIEESYGDRM